MELINNNLELSSEQIKQTEVELEIIFPDEYKQFLLNNNGGRPKETLHFIKKGDNTNWNFPINIFFGINEENSSCDLITTYAFYYDRIPEVLLPIADDGIGNKICIGINKEYLGKIYLWKFDQECNEDEQPTFDNIEKLSDSFNEFIKHLI